MNYTPELKIGLIAVMALSPLTCMHSAFAQNATPNFYLHDGDRVVMYGDSITAQNLYTTMVETYVTTRFPKLKVTWTDAGWGGDKVTGGGGGSISVRLNRDVLPYKPTVVTIMLAMNDGNYRAYDDATFGVFSKGYASILDTISASDPGVRYTLIQPSPFDDATRPPYIPGGYNGVLIKYGEYVKSLAAQRGQEDTDFNTPVFTMLKTANTTNPTVALKIVPDRVHPSPGGHLVMAEALLKTWNAPALVTNVVIDATKPAATQQDNCAVSNVASASGSVAWDELDQSLPMPYSQTDPVVALALKSSDFVQSIDQENLTVTGLAKGNYDFKIDAIDLGKFTDAQLSGGINLATLPTPMFAQASDVQGAVISHQGFHSSIYHNVQAAYLGDKNPEIVSLASQLAAKLLIEEQSLAAVEVADAQPHSHHYVITATP